MATPTPSFKRPADPLQPAGSAKRPATGPARTGTGAADSSPPSEETKDIAALKKQYQSREANLLIRLSRKEAEVQSLLSELQNLAPLLHPDSTNLTNKLLDPALLTLHVALRASLAEKDARIARLEEELAAREFTPQGIIGKRLIGRMKALQSENEELGKLLYGGRMEGLEVELGLAKKVASEAKTSLLDANSLIVELDNDLESLQAHLYNARAELKWYQSRYGRRDAIVREAETQTDEPEPERYEDHGRDYRDGYDARDGRDTDEGYRTGGDGNYRPASDGGDYGEQGDGGRDYGDQQEAFEGVYDDRDGNEAPIDDEAGLEQTGDDDVANERTPAGLEPAVDNDTGMQMDQPEGEQEGGFYQEDDAEAGEEGALEEGEEGTYAE